VVGDAPDANSLGGADYFIALNTTIARGILVERQETHRLQPHVLFLAAQKVESNLFGFVPEAEVDSGSIPDQHDLSPLLGAVPQRDKIQALENMHIVFALALAAALAQREVAQSPAAQIESEKVTNRSPGASKLRIVDGGGVIVAIAGVKIEIAQLWKRQKGVFTNRAESLLQGAVDFLAQGKSAGALERLEE